jgi:hypothetical protein
VVNPFTCSVDASTTDDGGGSVNATVVLAGLAPGLLGVYQMKIPQLVSNAEHGTAGLLCETSVAFAGVIWPRSVLLPIQHSKTSRR